MPLTRLYRHGVVEQEGFPVANVSELLQDPDAVVWFDLCSPTREDLATISEELSLHALAVDDATSGQQRPKLNRYDNHLFLTAYSVRFDPDSGELVSDEIDAFITKNALVTVRKTPDFDIDAVLRRWDSVSDLAKYGPAFLLHGLLDYVVDTQLDAVQALDQEIDALEDQIFDEATAAQPLQRRTFQLRKSLVALRRVALPMRDVVNTLLRRDLHVFDDALQPYFLDVYDHVQRSIEWTESLRDLVMTMLDTQLAVRGNRLNVVMKQVTSWAAIIAVPTLVTGYYGMNVPYPGFERPSGAWAAVAVMIGASGLLWAIFKRRGWL